MLQSLFLFRVQFLLPRYLSYFHVEGAGHYQERRKVMRTVPVSNAFSLGAHGHQKRQTFRRNKDKALDKEMVWATLCPPAELFVAGCVFWLSVRTTLLQSGGDTNGHKKCFHILVSCTAHKINIVSGILCCRPGSLVSGSWEPPPHDAEARAAPQCVPRTDQMQHMWKTVAAQIHKSQQKRSAALGERVGDI